MTNNNYLKIYKMINDKVCNKMCFKIKYKAKMNLQQMIEL